MKRKEIKAGELKTGDMFIMPKSARVYECYFVDGTIAGKTERGNQVYLAEDVLVFLIATQLKLF